MSGKETDVSPLPFLTGLVHLAHLLSEPLLERQFSSQFDALVTFKPARPHEEFHLSQMCKQLIKTHTVFSMFLLRQVNDELF